VQPVAILRFSPTEGPGRLGEWLDARAVPRRLIALDAGEKVPADPMAFAGIALMGGPMSANDPLPWNAPVLDLLRSAVQADVPVLGHCLGGQLFARALGAAVTRAAAAEIGWGEVRTTDDNGAREWFAGRDSFMTFQWDYDAFSLPPGSTRLLTNAYNAEQAYALGKHIAFQGHIEMTRDMVETWCRSGSAELPAQTIGATQSRGDILTDLDARLAALSEVADGVYAQWAKGFAC